MTEYKVEIVKGYSTKETLKVSDKDFRKLHERQSRGELTIIRVKKEA